MAGAIGMTLLLGIGSARAGVLLSYDFESVSATNLFVCYYGGGVVSNATMEALGASNTVSTIDPYGSRYGIGQASGTVARISSTNGDAYFRAAEKASNGSSVVAALNALTPGVYYLRISYDESKVGMTGVADSNFKLGVTINGSNGGSDQVQRGTPGTPGSFVGLQVNFGGVSAKDQVYDNAFVKCASEHERNNKTGGDRYPWRIQIVPSSATPGDLNVFKQGTFTEMDIIIQQNTSSGATYLDNIKIESFMLDRRAPIYLDDLMRTTEIGYGSPLSTAYVDYPSTTAPGDGMVELYRPVNVTNTPYTRAGDVTINVGSYVGAYGCAGSFGCGIHGYKFLGTSGFNRYHPLWIAGDGQTAPTNGVAIWTLRDQGLASHGFGAFANQLITFDLQKIRSYLLNGSTSKLRLTGRFGTLGENTVTDTMRGGVWVDGVRRFISTSKQKANPSDRFDLFLQPSDRYLTLIILNDGAWWFDNGVFKDVTLTVVPGGTQIGVE